GAGHRVARRPGIRRDQCRGRSAPDPPRAASGERGMTTPTLPSGSRAASDALPVLRGQGAANLDFIEGEPSQGSPAPSCTRSPTAAGPSPWFLAWRTFRRNRPAVVGLAVIVISILASVLAPVLSPHDPVQSNPAGRLAPPGSSGRVLGADHLGRDVLSRVLHGGRVSLVMGLAPVTAAAALALVLGLV